MIARANTARSRTWPQRIWDKLTPNHIDCWIWTAGRDQDGYGVAREFGHQKRAHRLVYELLVGPIPMGLTLDHLCRVPACCNPDHLEPVTSGTNTRRSPIAPTAVNARKTHCPRGHALVGPNLMLVHHGRSRTCRVCHYAQTEKSIESMKARGWRKGIGYG